MQINMLSGDDLKDLRTKHGVTQVELAEFLQYTVNGEPNRSQIARFENGYAKINPRISQLCRLYFETKK